MMATKSKELKKEESERLKEEGDQIKFINSRFRRLQVAGNMKGRRRQEIP